MTPERLTEIRKKLNDPCYLDRAAETIGEDFMNGHRVLDPFEARALMTEEQKYRHKREQNRRDCAAHRARKKAAATLL